MHVDVCYVVGGWNVVATEHGPVYGEMFTKVVWAVAIAMCIGPSASTVTYNIASFSGG